MKKGVSQWAIYDGRTNANVNSVSKSKKYTTSLSQVDKEKLSKLRKWAANFFAKNSSKGSNSKTR